MNIYWYCHEDIKELKRYFQVNSKSLFFIQAWNKVICPYLCRVVIRRLVLKPETSFVFQSGNNWLYTKKKQDQSISFSQRRGRCDRGGRVVQQANKLPLYNIRRRDGHGLLLLLWSCHSPQVINGNCNGDGNGNWLLKFSHMDVFYAKERMKPNAFEIPILNPVC